MGFGKESVPHGLGMGRNMSWPRKRVGSRWVETVIRDTGGNVLALTSVERSLNSVLNITLRSYCRFMESADMF